MGYSRTPTRRWGAVSTPLLSAKLLGGFSIRKRHWIAPFLSFPNMLQNFIFGVTDNITGRVKGKILDFLSLAASPGKAAVSNLNKTEE